MYIGSHTVLLHEHIMNWDLVHADIDTLFRSFCLPFLHSISLFLSHTHSHLFVRSRTCWSICVNHAFYNQWQRLSNSQLDLDALFFTVQVFWERNGIFYQAKIWTTCVLISLCRFLFTALISLCVINLWIHLTSIE